MSFLGAVLKVIFKMPSDERNPNRLCLNDILVEYSLKCPGQLDNQGHFGLRGTI